jgi:hypothetical protein
VNTELLFEGAAGTPHSCSALAGTLVDLIEPDINARLVFKVTDENTFLYYNITEIFDNHKTPFKR